MADDPFPRARVAATVRRMPAYLRLAWALARDPVLGRVRRSAVLAAAGYLASPIDLVPGVIPILGQLDDIAFALAALKFALAGLDPERRRRHLDAVGLADGDLVEDLRTMVVATAWLVRAGVRTTGKAALGGGRLALTGTKAAGRATSKTASAAAIAASRLAPAAKGAVAKAGPTARSAATKGGFAARTAAAKGSSAARGAAGRRPSVRLTIRRPPALHPGRVHAEEHLEVEPDVIALPGPKGPASGDPRP